MGPGLVVLSTILTITTIFPGADVGVLSVVLFALLGLVLAGMAAVSARGRPADPSPATTRAERHNWTTPPLEALPPPPSSRARRLALVLLRFQLLVAAALLLTKLVQLGVGT